MTFDIKQALAKLVSMRTLSDDLAANEAALDYIETFLASRGMYAKRFVFDGHGAMVATTRPGRKTPAVMLYAHVDVLAAPEEAFTLQALNGILRGRGVYDMKFAIAAYMQLVDMLKSNLNDYDFGIMITSDEEYGSMDDVNATPHLLREGYRPGIVLMFDGGDDWKIEYLAKGLWRFHLTAIGRSAHGARPWEGDSATLRLIHALRDIAALFPHQTPEGDTFNIGVVKGGAVINQIAEHAMAAVEFRLATEGSYDRLAKDVSRITEAYNLELYTRVLSPPTIHDLENQLVNRFQQSIHAVTGTSPGECISFGQSDAFYFVDAGIPCVLTRPPGGGAHGDEWLSETGLYELPKVLKHFIADVAGPNIGAVSDEIVFQKAKHH
jgi:succinyl-diaminopimelate desuccinylase